jgi:NAD(P)H-hydrate epimerase
MTMHRSTQARPLYLTASVRELETLARERFGITDVELMKRAGQAALDCLLAEWPNAKKITVVCGTGNNGGDGYVLAQLAKQHGLTVTVLTVGDPAKLPSPAREAYEACQQTHVTIQDFSATTGWAGVDVIVDAICGVGLRDAVRAEMQSVITAINTSRVPVLALDVPSGIVADTGQVAGMAVKATVTITFIGVKLGLLNGSGSAYTGKLHLHDLALPADLFALVTAALDIMRLPSFLPLLAPRPRDMNKGSAGHVLIVGGDEGHSGAVLMAAMAALRVGAGLVTIATHPAHASVLNVTCPEIMCLGVSTVAALQPLLAKATVIVVGPGLGQAPWGEALLAAVLATPSPLVVDADGLNILAKKPMTRHNWILTPHPGEAARLLHTTVPVVQNDRLAALQQLQQQYDGVTVLKGAGTLVNSAHHRAGLCDAGNPGMATAGMGDVLSGVIGGLVAQGLSLDAAARLGVCLHATAGDRAAAAAGERGLIATDLLPYLRALVNP